MNKQIEKLEETFKLIKKSIDEYDDSELLKDELELSDKLYDFIKSKNDKWFQKLFIMVKKKVNSLDEPLVDFNPVDCIIKHCRDNSNIEPDFIKYVENELMTYCNLDDNDLDDNDLDDNDLDDNNKIINLRDNQLDAINRTIEQGFRSGIHCQNMGAGKSIIMLKIIQSHHNEFQNNGSLYIITCFRQEILKDLFFGSKGELKNSEFWKRNNIINLNEFNVINCIDNKPKKLIIDDDKPNILIINTDYLKSLDKNKKINYSLINFVILDECHAISADKFYDIIYKYKYQYLISIIGLSATPLREKADKKLIDIFCKTINKNEPNKKLNLISSYDMFECIKDGITLSPHYTIVETKKRVGHKIGRTNKKVVKTIIDEQLNILPYKKIICWTKTISSMEEFFKFLKETYPDYKIYCSCSKDDKLNKFYNTNIDEFYKLEEKGFLICVNRCREGSDIKNLDCAIYLDAVKNRTTLVAMQTSGRVLRPDVLSKKTRGYIIDTFISDPEIKIEALSVEKIVGYYKKIFHLSENTMENKEQELNNIIDICEHIEIDEKNQLIKLKIDENEEHDNIFKFKLTTKQIDWAILKEEFGKHIMKGLSDDDKLKLKFKEFEKVKQLIKPLNFQTKEQYYDYISDYKYINNIELQNNPDDYYKLCGWTNYYDYFGINTSIYPENKTKFIERCKILNICTVTRYYNKYKKYNLPSMPEELYKDLHNLNDELKQNINVKSKTF